MNSYQNLISIENIFQAWSEFKICKTKRLDVQKFERNLEDNIFELYSDLKNKSYRHGSYQSFYVQDPKRRHIHKALVRDRVIHHLLYKYLYAIFDKHFICDSYSCRLNKGTHKGVIRLRRFIRIVSKNYTSNCFVLKLDIKKFFASVDHKILLSLLKKEIADPDILWLLEEVIGSFNSEEIATSSSTPCNENKGIPLGNLTSQIFANIYMNELDQFVKHKLRIKYYIRYADDFVILSKSRKQLEELIPKVENFLREKLKLNLHEKKIIIRKYTQGIDFLGYVVIPHAILPRTRTKKRMFKKLRGKINKPNFHESLQSYLGYLSHANSYKLTKELIDRVGSLSPK